MSLRKFVWDERATAPEVGRMLAVLTADLPAAEGGIVRLNAQLDGPEDALECRRETDGSVTLIGGSLSALARALNLAAAGIFRREKRCFSTFGIMIDCSRGAVLTVEAFKRTLRLLALAGYNMAMLYTEDVYELPGEEYFGYMRGRYTLAELREIKACADELGIEIIPCIQTLGHMGQALKYGVYSGIADTPECLLADEPATYRLIDKMLTFFQQAFGSGRIHIGMDETHGLGRGAFMDKHGWERTIDIYCRHLNKVVELCRAHGMRPMIWSDMICRLGHPDGTYLAPGTEITPEMAALVPPGVEMVYWDYYVYEDTAAFYDYYLGLHRKVGWTPIVASCLWVHFRLWNDHTINAKTVPPMIDTCLKGGVREFMLTLWGDDCMKCDYGSVFPDFFWSAELVWHRGGDAEKDAARTSAAATGGDYAVYERVSELMEKYILPGYPKPETSLGSEFLLWDDPLLGMFFRNFRLADPEGPEKVEANFRQLLAEIPEHYVSGEADFDRIRRIAAFLAGKLRFRIDLEARYAAGDRKGVGELAERAAVLAEQCAGLQEGFRRVWMRYYKIFGLELLQIRLAGQSERFREAARRLAMYAAGELENLPELEEKLSAPDPSFRGFYSLWNSGMKS